MTSETPRDPIHAALLERANAPDRLFLLKPQEALSFIEAGKAAGYSLVGVDGFRRSGGGYEPMPELSRWCAQADGSSRETFESEARTLIGRGDGDALLFEVWLEPDGWADTHSHA